MFDEDFFLDEREYRPENYMISDENKLENDLQELSQSHRQATTSRSSYNISNQIESSFQDTHLNLTQHSKHRNERDEQSDFMRFFENLHIDSNLAQNYCHALTEIGFDTVNSLQDVKEKELVIIGVKLGHARQIKRAISIVQDRSSPCNLSSNDQYYNHSLGQSYTIYDKDVYHDASFDEEMMYHDVSFEENLKSCPETKDVETSISPAIDLRSNENDLNTSLDASTCPDDMEYAKQKIKRMAARIHSLETQLTAKNNMGSLKKSTYRKAARHSTGNKDEKNILSPKKKILSKEERLQAHLRRKSLENKYKDTLMKFDKDSSNEKPSKITKNVKKNDDMVQRLTAANTSERRHHDEMKRKLKKRLTLDKSENVSSSNGTQKNNERAKLGNRSRVCNDESETTQSNILHSVEKNNISSNGKKFASSNGNKQVSKRDALMARLSMSTKDRRDLESKNIPVDVQRAIKGHKLKKTQWKMSENYASETEDSHIGDGEEINYTKQKAKSSSVEPTDSFELKSSRSQLSCATCNSEANCEEDIDDPGTFYCQRCWDEYEVEHPYELDCPPSPEKSISRDRPHKPIGSQPKSNKKKKRENEAIWLVHDNSLLGRKVSVGMKCLLETKDKSETETIRLVTGVIDYSGNVIKSALDSAEEIKKCEIGSECFRLKNALGYIVKRDNVEKRKSKNGKVIEIQLNESDGIVLTAQGRSKTKIQSTMREFLHGCDEAIDVILEPQQNSSSWYPLWDDNNKKIAPHFRSKGIGYIRLGDDMSKYGAAFLSCDECQSFLSSIPDIWSPLKNVKNSSDKSAKDNKTLAPRIKDKANTQNKVSQKNITHSPLHEKEDIDELLKKIQNDDIEKEMTWQEKAEIIKRLGNCISLQQDGETHATAALTLLQNIICSKNVNIHVLRTSIHSIASIGQRIKHELVVHISFRAIMAELLKLLKNKQVSNDVRNTLNNLHKECFRLCHVIALISQALGFGKPIANGNKVKVNRASSSSSSPGMGSSRRTSSGGGNNVLEILDWLAGAIHNESQILNCTTTATAQLPVLDKFGILTLLQFFVSHIGHRYAKCRKYVENGIVHSIVYGVEQEIIEFESFTSTDSICREIKTSNTRMWKNILLRITKLGDKEID